MSVGRSTFLLLLLVFFVSPAAAHPVAQGSVEIDIRRDEIRARFRVSNEQIFVASTFGTKSTAAATSLEQMWQDHAAYLLAHVTVSADGTPLTGECLKVTPPTDLTISGFTEYDLRYPAAAPPGRVTISERLLNEIEFAPGNPWEATFAAKILRDGAVVEEARLLSARQSLECQPAVSLTDQFQTPASGGLGRLARDFFLHGMHHIAAGWDHALFVAALVLAVGRFWQVVALVTAFTIAHTVTLTLAALRIAHLPREVVEPMIAVSIIVGAALNFYRPGEDSLRPRLIVAFGFGLFHGLGFAGGLIDAMQGYSASAIASAIAGFSVGVEAGHQIVVIPLVVLMVLCRRWAPASVPWTIRAGSAGIVAAGVFLLTIAWK